MMAWFLWYIGHVMMVAINDMVAVRYGFSGVGMAATAAAASGTLMA